jgi:hypothetical protein
MRILLINALAVAVLLTAWRVVGLLGGVAFATQARSQVSPIRKP